MGGQRSFTLIPAKPASFSTATLPTTPTTNSPFRPMTSKQVQKAYAASRRGPKLTRAERFAQERAEQERIRKELDKEKTAARSRAARDRKKEKDDKEKDRKRKIGLPTVDVRASQDTIARFVRGNGAGRKRDVGGVVVGAAEQETTKKAEELDLIPEEDDVDDEMLSGLAEVKSQPRVSQCGCPEGVAQVKTLSQQRPFLRSSGHQAGSHPPPPPLPASSSHSPVAKTRKATSESQPKPPPPSISRQKSPSPEPQKRPPSPPSPPRQAPPMSTQAILFNVDDFFPSASQQARELEDESDDFSAAVAPKSVLDRPQPQRRDIPPPPLFHATPKAVAIVDYKAEQEEPDLPEDFFEDIIGFSQIPLDAPATNPQLHQPVTHPPPLPERTPEPPPVIAVERSCHQDLDMPEDIFEELADSSPEPPAVKEPGRFFTSSGTREMMSVAMLRSRRDAALEEIRRKERVPLASTVRNETAGRKKPSQEHVGGLSPMPSQRRRLNHDTGPSPRQTRQVPAAFIEANRTKNTIASQSKPFQPPTQKQPANPPFKPPVRPPIAEADKENAMPLLEEDLDDGSQETEYGGDWVDDLAMELMI